MRDDLTEIHPSGLERHIKWVPVIFFPHATMAFYIRKISMFVPLLACKCVIGRAGAELWSVIEAQCPFQTLSNRYLRGVWKKAGRGGVETILFVFWKHTTTRSLSFPLSTRCMGWRIVRCFVGESFSSALICILVWCTTQQMNIIAAFRPGTTYNFSFHDVLFLEPFWFKIWYVESWMRHIYDLKISTCLEHSCLFWNVFLKKYSDFSFVFMCLPSAG